jgi:hypothetical protein
MGYDRDFDEFLTTTVVYAPPNTMSVHGAQTFSTATFTVAARIEHDTRMVRDSLGNEVVSNTVVFLKPTSTTGATFTPVVSGRITLPAGNEPLTPQIVHVAVLPDVLSEGAGTHHWEVRL